MSTVSLDRKKLIGALQQRAQAAREEAARLSETVIALATEADALDGMAGELVNDEHATLDRHEASLVIRGWR